MGTKRCFTIVVLLVALVSIQCGEKSTQPSGFVNPYEWVGPLHNQGLEKRAVSLWMNKDEILASANPAQTAFKYACVGTDVKFGTAMAPTARDLEFLHYQNAAATEKMKKNNPLFRELDSLLKRGPTPDQFDLAVNRIEQRVASDQDAIAKWCALAIVKYSYRYWTENGDNWRKIFRRVNIRNVIASPDTGGEEGGGGFWYGFTIADLSAAIWGGLECLPYLAGYPYCVAAYGLAGSIVYGIWYFGH